MDHKDRNKPKRKRKPIYIDLTVDNSNMDPFILFQEKKRLKCKEEIDYFQLIPDEIITKIFTFLYPEDLMNCTLVSKRFRSLADEEEIWKNQFLKHKFDPDSFFTRKFMNGKTDWKDLFLMRYKESCKYWKVKTEYRLPEDVYWASLSHRDNFVYILTSTSLNIATLDLRILDSINCDTYPSVYYQLVKADVYPSLIVYNPTPPTGIFKIYHDKKNDAIVMFHESRGILVFCQIESKLHLLQEIKFEMSSFSPIVNLDIDTNNKRLVCSLNGSIYVVQYITSPNEETSEPIKIHEEVSKIHKLMIKDDLIFWKAYNGTAVLWNLKNEESIWRSDDKNRDYLLFVNDDVSLVRSRSDGKVIIEYIGYNKKEVLNCYKSDGIVYLHEYPSSRHQFFTSNDGGIIKLWDMNLKKCIDTFSMSHIQSSQVLSLYCGEEILIASEKDKWKVWNLNSKVELFIFNRKDVNLIDYFGNTVVTLSNQALSILHIER